MDMIEKLQDIFDGAIKIEGKLIEDIKYFIVYFIHDNDIVFIGKTSNVLEYVNERKEKYSASHYYLEEIDANIIDNYFAQLILEIQPVFNSRIPNNTKYISHHIAKKDYFVYKPEFRKVFDEHGGYMYKNSLFIEKKIFDDVFARIPHNQDMPRIKRIILLVEDYKNLQLVQTGGMIEDTLYDISGNKVTALRDYKPDFPGEYKKIKTLEDYPFKCKILENSFKAVISIFELQELIT